MHFILLFFAFMHLHLPSHLGMLDEPREGQGVEPNPKTVYGGPIPKMEGLSKC
jgi:hypothetical protein